MNKANDGKSDFSVSYTPIAPLNKEEESIDAIFDEFMNGKPPFANEDAKVQAQAFVNYLKPKFTALFNSHIREARIDELKGLHKLNFVENIKGSTMTLDDIIDEQIATLDNINRSGDANAKT